MILNYSVGVDAMPESALEKQLLNEIRELKDMVKHLENLLVERLIGVEEPLPDEVEAIRDYESEKERGKVELVKLEDVLKESGRE